MSRKEKKSAGAQPGPFPTWKKLLLAGAAVLVVGGAALKGYGYVRHRGQGEVQTRDISPNAKDGLGPQSLVGQPDLFPPPEGSEPRRTQVEDRPVDDWSPALMKGGLGFFVGFCVGYALRTFFRISAVVFGMVFLAILGLSYAGVVEVDWQSLQGFYDRAVVSLKEEFTNFQSFVAGSLPMTGLGALGVFTGFKRN